MSNQEITEFEFLLTIDENIIVQRMFKVQGYNPNVKKSLDLYYTVTSICEIIENDMKQKTLEYMCDNQNYYDFDINPDLNNQNKKDNFYLSIKLGEEVFIERVFPANVYHPHVRVDVRPMLKDFLYELTDILSSKELEETYLGKDLEVNYLGKE
jgi:hypothetical protein